MVQQKNKNISTSNKKRRINRYVNLNSKNNLDIITYDFESETLEDINERIKKLNLELEEMIDQYYSSNVTVERIQGRNLLYIIKTVVYRHKKANNNKT